MKTKIDRQVFSIPDLFFKTLLINLACTSVDIAVAGPCSA
jgi:hypothetical protein